MTKEFTFNCEQSLCDQELFRVWLDESKTDEVCCPKCFRGASLIKLDKEKEETNDDNKD